MKEIFAAYYHPTPDEFKGLWDQSIFIFDTNVFLNLYRYSKNTLDGILNLFETLSDRAWMPHQVALEYQDNRLNIIQGQERPYREIPKILDETKRKIQDALYTEHLSIDVNELNTKIETSFNSITQDLQSHKELHPDLFADDYIRERISKLFAKKTGLPYSQDELTKIYKDGEERYKNQIPPGYKDLKDKQGKVKRYGNLVIKSEYGDFIVWKQIIDHAIKEKKPVIFISDDQKEDWWWISGSRTIGPRPELITEFKASTGHSFYMYTIEKFINFSREYLKTVVDQNIVDEVKEVSDDRLAWKDIVIDALKDLGGVAPLVDIYSYIEHTTPRELPKTWTATIRRTLQTFSSDTETYAGGDDLFAHLGRGLWGLRNSADTSTTTTTKLDQEQ
ncbi:MAG: PIN domain-containing protein [Anaerolineae bacterium]|nr:PIN domain-containing protein [Anaerolineae bacterium]